MSTPPRILGGAQARKRRKRHCDPQSASRRGGDTSSVPEASHPSREDAPLADTADSARASAARVVFSHINDSRVNSSNAMRAAHAVAPKLAYPPQWRLPTTDVKPLTRSKCRRRRRGAPPCRGNARGGGRFSVLLPRRDRNRLWFGPTKHFRVGRYMANRRSVNSKTIPQWVYQREVTQMATWLWDRSVGRVQVPVGSNNRGPAGGLGRITTFWLAIWVKYS